MTDVVDARAAGERHCRSADGHERDRPARPAGRVPAHRQGLAVNPACPAGPRPRPRPGGPPASGSALLTGRRRPGREPAQPGTRSGPGGVAAVGEARAALEDVPGADVAGKQPGHPRGGEVERQHEQAAAPGVLGGVPGLVPEQGGVAAEHVVPGEDHVSQREGGRGRHRQPVAGADEQPVGEAGQPGAPGQADGESGQRRPVEQVDRQPDPVPWAHCVRSDRPRRVVRPAVTGRVVGRRAERAAVRPVPVRFPRRSRRSRSRRSVPVAGAVPVAR